jgi:hypothetical protein
MVNVASPPAEEATGRPRPARMLLAPMMVVFLAAAWSGPAYADEAVGSPAVHANGVRPPNCGTPNTPACAAPQSTTLVPLPYPPHTPIIKG